MRKYLSIFLLILVLAVPSWAVEISSQADINSATTSVAGKVELATDAETVTGTSDSVVTTPGNITARLASPGTIGGTTPGRGIFTDFYLYGSGVTHGITSICETNQYVALFALDSSLGGFDLFGISDGDATGVRITGIMGTDNPTDILPAFKIVGAKKNGTGYQALGNAESVLGIYNYTTLVAQAYGNGEWIFAAIEATPIGDTVSSTGTFTTLIGLNDEVIKATSSTLGATELKNTIINNFGQGAANNLQQLPVAAEGMASTVICGTAQAANYFRLQAFTTDKIYFNGVAGADNGYVTIAAPTVGAAITIWTFKTGESTYDWFVNVINGNWVAGGP